MEFTEEKQDANSVTEKFHSRISGIWW